MLPVTGISAVPCASKFFKRTFKKAEVRFIPPNTSIIHVHQHPTSNLAPNAKFTPVSDHMGVKLFIMHACFGNVEKGFN